MCAHNHLESQFSFIWISPFNMELKSNIKVELHPIALLIDLAEVLVDLYIIYSMSFREEMKNWSSYVILITFQVYIHNRRFCDKKIRVGFGICQHTFQPRGNVTLSRFKSSRTDRFIAVSKRVLHQGNNRRGRRRSNAFREIGQSTETISQSDLNYTEGLANFLKLMLFPSQVYY